MAFGQAAGAENAYVGAKKCKACHLNEFKSWSETKMANAFELLKPGVACRGQDEGEARSGEGLHEGCELPSSATRPATASPAASSIFATTPDLVGVQCEMCHGPGGTYTQKEYMSLQNKEYKKAELVKVGLVGQITKDTCVNCHNPKSPFFKDFKFEERKSKGTHEKYPLKYPH